MTASKEQAYKLYTSYGIIRMMIFHLKPIEQLELQLANKFFYDIAVSRV